jgi:hypothetical protein
MSFFFGVPLFPGELAINPDLGSSDHVAQYEPAAGFCAPARGVNCAR